MLRMKAVPRFAELRLLVFVAGLLILGYVAVVASAAATFNATPVVVPITFLGLALGLHLFLVARGVRGDQLLLPLALALTAIGLVEVQRLAPERLALQQLT